jgi:phosphohistidine phosphatase
MLITCLRHATAELQSFIAPDAERALIKKGIKQVQRVVEFCSRNDLLPITVYCSPLRRAEQTAALLQAGLSESPQTNSVEWLSLGSSPYTIVDELKRLDSNGINDVWLVGHEPDLSALLGLLLGIDSPSCFIIKKASLTRIEIDFAQQSTGQLLWSLPCALMN